MQFVSSAGRLLLACGIALLSSRASAVEILNGYRSPRNPERKLRQSTELIVLHTTEAPARSSLNKVSERGECHFVVTESGSIYRIIDRDREAFHAGRSMWRGREDVDKFSIGIECVGYHDKPMGSIQLKAIRDLVKSLQATYRLSDDKVVCHSHVAYGAPNRWHRRRHRGRKRCGMLFAMPSVRAKLGLDSRPARDEDTRARRLVVGDPYLQKVLYGTVDTMRGRLGTAAPAGSAGSGGMFSWLGFGKEKPKAAVSTPKKPVKRFSTSRTRKTSAIPKQTATSAPRSVAELKARGYTLRGTVSKSQTAVKIAGPRWNDAATYYVIRGKVTPGNRLDQSRIESGMTVWMK